MFSASIHRKLLILVILLLVPLIAFVLIGERYISVELKKIQSGKSGLGLIEAVWSKTDEINKISVANTTEYITPVETYFSNVSVSQAMQKKIQTRWNTLTDENLASTKRLLAAQQLISDITKTSQLMGFVTKTNPELVIVAYDRIPELSFKIEKLTRLSERLKVKDQLNSADNLAFLVNAGQFKTVADYISRNSRRELDQHSPFVQEKMSALGKAFRKQNGRFQSAALKASRSIQKSNAGRDINITSLLKNEIKFDNIISDYWRESETVFRTTIANEESRLQKIYRNFSIGLALFVFALACIIWFLHKSIMKQAKELEQTLVQTEEQNLALTQRKEQLKFATNKAESGERAKTEFLANMSHEIRTPMNGIMGMAELLQTTTLDGKQKMFTDVIVKSSNSLLTIINDILDFSKIDAGQLELTPAPFELTNAFEEVTTLISTRVAEKKLEMILRVDPSLPAMLVGDVGRLRQIITNLLGNAVKFTEKGHIYINVEGVKTQKNNQEIVELEVTIEDTGIGIAENERKKIFSKFSQVDGSATRAYEGTGLGLSISSSLVNMMDGEIGVESELEKGSKFWFKIPLEIHAENVIQNKIPTDLHGSHILIIDDNAINRRILTEQMTYWNFDSAAASSGAEGLQVMRKAKENGINIELVILDYQMPEMNGVDVLREIRNDLTLKDTAVLMLTSVDSSCANQSLTKFGIEGNLIKPTRSNDLFKTIVQVISNHRMKRHDNADKLRISA